MIEIDCDYSTRDDEGTSGGTGLDWLGAGPDPDVHATRLWELITSDIAYGEWTT